MTMNREVLLDFAELSHLSIPCGKCKTRTVLDCADVEARIPEECPSCSQQYDAGFRSTLQKYREVYRKLSDPQGRSVQVRIAGAREGATP